MNSISNENINILKNAMLDLETRVKILENVLAKQKSVEKMTIIVFSGDFDKLLSAFIIADAAASMAIETTMFFTFWGLNALKKNNKLHLKKTPLEKMFTLMMPKNANATPLSRKNMLGIGKKFMAKMMKKHNVASLSDLIQIGQDLNVKYVACQMTMEIMGIKKSELIENIQYGGAACYIQNASEAKFNLYI